MRVMVLGGTRFIGAAVVEELVAHGHELLIVHRGEHEPPDLPEVDHLHADRQDLPTCAARCTSSAPRRWSTTAPTRPPTPRPPSPPSATTSACWWCRAWTCTGPSGRCWPDRDRPGAGRRDLPGPPRPLPLPDPARHARRRTYEKLDVEEAYLARAATVCRLPAVYGERDHQRREEPILRRVRAGRARIPAGSGGWLWTRGYVRDVAAGSAWPWSRTHAWPRSSTSARPGPGRWACGPATCWRRPAPRAELVRVPDVLLPDDLKALGTVSQHLLVDSSKARDLLGWTETDRTRPCTVGRLHLANPPEGADAGFEADDRALVGRARSAGRRLVSRTGLDQSARHAGPRTARRSSGSRARSCRRGTRPG
jgi:UDP-glucose 4-epimerase